MTAAVTPVAGDAARAKPQRLPRRRLLMLPLLLFGLAAPAVVTTSTSRMLLDVVADPPALLIAGGMLPGDRMSSSVRISNEGQVPVRYAVTTVPDVDVTGLPSVLIAEVGVSRTGCGDLNAVALGRAPLAQLAIGDPEHGAQPGDRTLATGESETICIRVTLPRAAGDRYQDATASARFSVVAEPIERSPDIPTTYLSMAGHLAALLTSPVGLVGLLALLGTALVAIWLLEERQRSKEDASKRLRASAKREGSRRANKA